MNIESFYDPNTATFTYVVSDPETQKCAVIDPVLDYDAASVSVSETSADKVLTYIKTQNLTLEWILETHIHADHLTAAHYFKTHSHAQIGIGSGIKKVLDHWIPALKTSHNTPADGSQFDHVFEDGETFMIGNLNVKVIHTPGHTPACVSYIMGDTIFVGDTIFMPHLGTARADFPDGSAHDLYMSIQKILSFPDDTKLYTGHDYPKTGTAPNGLSTVSEQKASNKMIHDGVSEADYIAARKKRDATLSNPKLLLPAIETNMRAGEFVEL